MEQNRKILSLRTPVQGHHHPRFQQLLAKPIKEGVEWIVPVAGDKSPPAPEDDLAMAVHRRSERALSSPPPPRAYRTSSAGSSVPMDRRGRSGPLQRMSSRGSDRSSMSRSSTVLSLPEEPWSSEPKSSRGRASDGSVQSGRRRPPAQGEVLVPMLAEEGTPDASVEGYAGHFPDRQGGAPAILHDEAVLELLAQAKKKTTSVRYRCWLTLEEPNSSWFAWIYMVSMTIIIGFSVLITLLESSAVHKARWGADFFETSDIWLNVVFSMELVVRFAVARRWKTFFTTGGVITQDNFYNIVDGLSIVPFYLKMLWQDLAATSFFELVVTMRPTLRLLKVTRNFDGFQLLVRSVQMALPQLPVPLFMFFLMSLFFGSAIWFAEQPAAGATEEAALESIPSGLWFAIVTISTVGYGDVTPTTVVGKVLTSLTIILGMLYMAMPLTVVGQAFQTVWDSRDQIFVLEKARRRLRQLGIEVQFMRRVFDCADVDGSGTLEAEEFHIVVQDILGLGLSPYASKRLFHFFDEDGSGSVDFLEFVEKMVDPIELKQAGIVQELDLADDHRSQESLDPSLEVSALLMELHTRVEAVEQKIRLRLKFLRREVATIKAGMIPKITVVDPGPLMVPFDESPLIMNKEFPKAVAATESTAAPEDVDVQVTEPWACRSAWLCSNQQICSADHAPEMPCRGVGGRQQSCLESNLNCDGDRA